MSSIPIIISRRSPDEVRKAVERQMAHNPDVAKIVETLGGIEGYMRLFNPALGAAVIQVSDPPQDLPHGVRWANDSSG
jgi:hypothetical protein